MQNDSYLKCQCPVFNICIYMEEYVSIITIMIITDSVTNLKMCF